MSNESSLIKEYKWYNSCNIPLDLQCGILRLEMPADFIDTEAIQDLYITAQIISYQLPAHEPPLSTLYGTINSDSRTVSWDHVISFPVKVRDLSFDSVISYTVWTPDGRPFAGTTTRIFNERGSMKQGKQKLVLFPGKTGDPNVVYKHNRTPGDFYSVFHHVDFSFQNEKVIETFRLRATQNVLGRGEQRNEWLDRFMAHRINNPQNDPHRLALQQIKENEELWGRSLERIEMQKYAFLIVEMPTLNFPILHEERQYPAVEPHCPPTSLQDLLSKTIVEIDNQSMEFALIGRHFDASWLTIVADWEMDQDNLYEEQNRRLTHNVRRGTADSTVKPNKEQKARIDRIISAVGNLMSTDDMDFLYRFRYSLTENKKALIKFLYTVNWEEESEVEELPILLNMWKQRSPIDVVDALKLLSKEKSFEHSYVREYAVEVLRSASDDELLLFLLQLVQALRYEPAAALPPAEATPINNAVENIPSAEVVSDKRDDKNVVDYALEQSIVGINHLTMRTSIEGHRTSVNDNASVNYPTSNAISNLSPLGKFLIDRACKSPVVANYLYWYLKVETALEDESSAGGVFNSTWDTFVVQLSQSKETQMLFKRLMALDEYISQIAETHRDARARGKRREGKEQMLIKFLEDKQLQHLPSGLDWVPMPLDPSIKLTGIVPSTVKMFSSAVYPVVIEFRELEEGGKTHTDSNGKPKGHKIMFKSGDDLRQDQLVMQMISLMDSLLKKVNLDLKLLTYGILAVGPSDGIMEFVQQSMPISAILGNFGSITEYLRTHNPDKNGPYGISAVALDTFVKSCAGYCVITFILGIGDRHLDNVMMNTSGQMFHIDFGFIFGQDPKPFPPPFRLNQPMVDAMGGEDSEHYTRFKTLCCQSYNWLRKSANLILNLLSLMGDAGIQDISKRSDLGKVLMRVEEKFRLDLTDELAEQYFIGLIKEAVHSLAPKIMEIAHKFAVSMR